MRSLLIALSAIVLIAGCDQRQERKPNAVGGQGEVLVVMTKGHWESAPGAAVRNFLERPIARLPQREGRFKVAHTTPDAFGKLLSAHHNVLYAAIGDAADTNATIYQRDRYAIGQLLVRINAEMPEIWLAQLHEQGDEIVRFFEEHQRNRIISRLSGQMDAAIVSSLRSAHGLTIQVPTGFRTMKQDGHFTWLQRDRLMSGSGLEHNVIEGILIYHYPYTSENTFNVEYLVNMRDSVTKEYVNGPVDGSYMIVQRGFEEMDLMPESRATRLGDRFAYLMHGLYGMHGAKMGGPFVSLTTIDEDRNRVVTVEGFVYAPQFDKREYLRELEAILFTLELGTKDS